MSCSPLPVKRYSNYPNGLKISIPKADVNASAFFSASAVSN